ncbi:MAG: glycyl-radical enzyme activating protein [Clostridium sp.]|nr:glycyl-radical enzyme activating protein [Clostridium sp.]
MDTIDYSMTGLVFDIQRYSIHDGPGIRTIVFLKGCPLSCKWCSNPESQSLKPVVMYQSMNCIHCGRCIAACKKGAISPNNEHYINRDICTACGECVNVCPASALTLKGTKMTVEQVIKELKKDATNYRRSGGGVTLSGGEPLVQHEFSREILKASKAQGWNTAIETTGCAGDEAIENVIPYVDLALMDIKNINADLHKKYTGVSNEGILKNAKKISKMTNMVVRVPVIPNFNYDENSIYDICSFAKTLNNISTIHLLPYHSYGENKYDLLGRDYFMKEFKQLHNKDVEFLKEIVEKQGFKCIIGG